MSTPTDWEYNSTHDLNGKTFHLWERRHPSGYIAFALTEQPASARISHVKPIGTGHFVGPEGLKAKTGISATSNSEGRA